MRLRPLSRLGSKHRRGSPGGGTIGVMEVYAALKLQAAAQGHLTRRRMREYPPPRPIVDAADPAIGGSANAPAAASPHRAEGMPRLRIGEVPSSQLAIPTRSMPAIEAAAARGSGDAKPPSQPLAPAPAARQASPNPLVMLKDRIDDWTSNRQPAPAPRVDDEMLMA